MRYLVHCMQAAARMSRALLSSGGVAPHRPTSTSSGHGGTVKHHKAATKIMLNKPNTVNTRRSSGRAAAGISRLSASVDDTKMRLLEACEPTGNGLTATDEQRSGIEALICDLETLNPTRGPGESDLLEGMWRVVYSTAPPPSNGSLGPFKGTAYQNVNLEEGVYANILEVPPNAWLAARLEAGWVTLNPSRWRVIFKSIAISLFGFKLFSKDFEDTTRVWDFTYLDEDLRVVRAARNDAALDNAGARGRKAQSGDEDDTVFVMVRA